MEFAGRNPRNLGVRDIYTNVVLHRKFSIHKTKARVTPKLSLTTMSDCYDIPRAHETSLKHDGKLQRWCPVQEDVEDYFRKTLEEVRVHALCSSRGLGARGAHAHDPRAPRPALRPAAVCAC